MTTNVMKSLKITHGTNVGDVRMMRVVVYAYVGKGCGHVIGGVLGAAGGFVIGGIAGVMAIPEGFRKGLEKACKDPFVTQHQKSHKGLKLAPSTQTTQSKDITENQ